MAMCYDDKNSYDAYGVLSNYISATKNFYLPSKIGISVEVILNFSANEYCIFKSINF